MFSFEKLRVYQMARELVKEIPQLHIHGTTGCFTTKVYRGGQNAIRVAK